MIIAICGNVASGKTTLARYICQNYKFSYIPNKRIELEFLRDFFDNIPEYFLQTQLSFLVSKAMQIKSVTAAGENIVIDRSLEEDIHVFAKLWIDNCKIDERVQKLYLETANYIMSSLPSVDMYILCDCSPEFSKKQMFKRGKRDYEEKYPENHVEQLYEYMQNVKYPESSAYVRIDSEKWDFQDKQVLEELILEIFENYNEGIEKQYQQLSIFDYNEELSIPVKRHKYIEEYKVGDSVQRIEVKGLKRGKKIVYLAAPFTSVATDEERQDDIGLPLLLPDSRGHGVLPLTYQRKLEKIRKFLTERWKMQVILPHKDVNEWGTKELSADKVLREIVKNVTESDILIAIPSTSIGVHLEVGIALAQHKPVIIFDVDELENSFYVSGFEVLKGVKSYRVNTITDIINILKRNEVYNFVKEFSEVHKDEIY